MPATLQSGLMNASQTALDAVLKRSAMARAVQLWWRQKWQKRSAPSTAAGATGKRHSTMHRRQTRAAQAMHSGTTGSAMSWLSHSGRRFLGRLSNSIELSSDRGRSSRVELVESGAGGRGRCALAVDDRREKRSSSCDSDGDWWSGSSDMSRTRATGVQAGIDDFGPATGGMKEHRTPPPSPSSSENESSSDEDSQQHNNWEGSEAGSNASRSPANTAFSASTPSPSAAPAEDDGRFTLSWVRGLRHRDMSGTSATPSAGGADDSFRNASQLLAKSRARFALWLQRRRRLRSAKRALAGEWWRSGFSHAGDGAGGEAQCRDGAGLRDPQRTDVNATTGGDSHTTSEYERAASELKRTMLQRAPSSWEQALPCPPAVANTGSDNTDSGTLTSWEQRALVRAALQQIIAAATAARRTAAECAAKDDHHLSASLPGDTTKAHSVGRAAQEERAHGEALTQLANSIRLLENLRSGARGRISASSQENSVSTAADELPDARKGVASTILSSHHSSYAMHTCTQHGERSSVQVPTRLEQQALRREGGGAAARDGANAFRSLLVDTTHTPHDAAVRLLYEEVMNDVCTAQVRQEVDAVAEVSRSAADRALSQWVERQLLRELATMPPSTDRRDTPDKTMRADSTSNPYRSGNGANGDTVFTGILQHIRSRVPASLSRLRLDDADQRALAYVYARRDSDATAVSLQTAGYTITYRQLASLSADAWLNDQVINNYLQLLCEDVESRQQESQRQRTDAGTARNAVASQSPHGVVSMGTHFYAKVEAELAQTVGISSSDFTAASTDGLPPLAANSATLRWLRRRQHLLQPFDAADAQSVRAVLIPVNIEAQHWALVVYYRDDRRWVLYDSMSRSDRARQRGRLILARLSHVWRACQRHYGFLADVRDDDFATPTTASGGAETLLVAAAYAPSSTKEESGVDTVRRSPLDSLQPYGSMTELYRAAKRLRHQEEQLVAGESYEEGGFTKHQQKDSVYHHQQEQQQRPVAAWPSPSLTAATSLPASMLTDVEVEWFTDGFARIPQQRNGYDCGVFVCQVAWCVAHGVAVGFTQVDVTLLRHVITLELLSKRLLRRYPTEHTSSSADV
jgi:hypothetical protein